ncbi:MAG: YncE family protein [Acidobacteriota bacterium]|nr:YncE family protein [Acidobacteriota bacterium]
MKGGSRVLVFVFVVVVLTGAGWAVAEDPTVVATVQLGQSTCCSITGVAVNPDTNRIYVTDLSKDLLYVLDGATNTLEATVPVTGRPFGVKVNPFTNLVYVSSIDDEAIYVIDGATDSLIDTIPVPHTPLDLVMDFMADRLYAANPASSCVCEIDCTTNSVQGIPLDPRPQGLGVDLVNGQVWVGHESACVSVIEEDAAVEPIVLGSRPVDVAVNPLVRRAYACDRDNNNVYMIDTKTHRMDEVALAGSPRSIATNPLSRRVYVVLADDSLQVLDGLSDSIVATVPVGDGPMDVAVNPLTGLVYIVHFVDGTLHVISDHDAIHTPQRAIVSHLNHLLVELSTTVDGAKLVGHVHRAIAVLQDDDPGNDFRAAAGLVELIEEVEMSDKLPEDQARRITLSARRIITMFVGG